MLNVLDEFTHECLTIRVAAEMFMPAFAAWSAALRRPAPPATLAQRPTLD
jgi:hypothetical protein